MKRRRYQVCVRVDGLWSLVAQVYATRIAADRAVYGVWPCVDDVFYAEPHQFATHGLPRSSNVAMWWRRVVGRQPQHHIRQRVQFVRVFDLNTR
jgi:hypothetical protein